MVSKQKSKTFGETIRQLRMVKDITLRDFARRMDVSPTYVSQVEQDKIAPPTQERVAKMAELLDENPDDLMALAGRLPQDLPRIIQKHPREMAAFLRTANGLTAEDIEGLTDRARKLKTRGKK